MKKVLLFTLLISMTLILTACGKANYIGTWKHTEGNYEYVMTLNEDKTWTLSRNDVKREGTYNILEIDGRTILELVYPGTIGNGYTEYEDGKMCACKKDKCEVVSGSEKCTYYFEKDDSTNDIFKK